MQETAPLSVVAPRHRRLDAEDLACPPWCDESRCIKSASGGIHVGVLEHWYSTVSDVEFGLARYQDIGEPEAFLLTLRRIAGRGPIELTVSRNDLLRLITVADRLCNAHEPVNEAAAEVDASGDASGAHAITA